MIGRTYEGAVLRERSASRLIAARYQTRALAHAVRETRTAFLNGRPMPAMGGVLFGAFDHVPTEPSLDDDRLDLPEANVAALVEVLSSLASDPFRPTHFRHHMLATLRVLAGHIQSLPEANDEQPS